MLRYNFPYIIGFIEDKDFTLYIIFLKLKAEDINFLQFPVNTHARQALDAAVAGFTEVEVPQFERKELDNCINYYIQEKWLNKGN